MEMMLPDIFKWLYSKHQVVQTVLYQHYVFVIFLKISQLALTDFKKKRIFDRYCGYN